MKSFNFNKFALAAGTVLACAVSTQALAAPSFTFSPPGNGLQSPAFPNVLLDQFNGLSSELITFNDPSAIFASGNANENSAVGYLYITGGSLNGSNQLGFGRYGDLSGINGNPAGSIGLYLKFDLTNHAVSSDSSGTTFQLDTLNFTWYADVNNNTTFSTPDATTATPTAALVTGGATDDVVIATGSLYLPAGAANNANIGPNGSGAAVALKSTETVVDPSAAYFTYPVPFYTLALDAFNNTGGAYKQSATGQYGSISGAGGNVTFSNIPEPDSLALVAIAMVGMGVAARRRKS